MGRPFLRDVPADCLIDASAPASSAVADLFTYVSRQVQDEKHVYQFCRLRKAIGPFHAGSIVSTVVVDLCRGILSLRTPSLEFLTYVKLAIAE